MNEILSELFSSKLRAAVLEQMLPRPHVGYSLTDLSRLLELPISSLQHECYKLERIGVVKARRDGNSRRYRVNPDCAVLKELTALIVVAIGHEPALRASMERIPGLDAAFLATAIPLSDEAQAEQKHLKITIKYDDKKLKSELKSNGVNVTLEQAEIIFSTHLRDKVEMWVLIA